MMTTSKRVFIIHEWGGSPEKGWLPWIKKELENKNFSVQVPSMPNTDEPRIESWVSHLSNIVGSVNENTFFVGHSIGCQTILRYLETLSEDKRVGGAVFVAGWFTLTNLETAEEREIAKPWLETEIDLEKVKQHVNKFIAIFSDNDPHAPLSDSKIFEEKLGAEIIVEHDKKHFSGDDGITELPVALDSVLKLAKS